MALISQEQGGFTVTPKPKNQKGNVSANQNAIFGVSSNVFNVPIKIHKVPSVSNPFQCIVELPSAWFEQGKPGTTDLFYLRYGVPSPKYVEKGTPRNRPRFRKQNEPPQQVATSSPAAQGAIILNQWQRFQACNIDTSKILEFWAEDNGVAQKFLNIHVDTLSGYSYVEELSDETVQHIIDNFVDYPGITSSPLSLLLGYAPTVNFAKDIQIDRTQEGLTVSLPRDPSLAEDLSAQVYYRESTSDQQNLFGTIEPGTQYPFAGDGLYSFMQTCSFGQHVVRADQYDRDYVKMYSPVKSNRATEANIPLFVQVSDTDWTPILPSGFNSPGWDKLWITHGLGETNLFPADTRVSNSFAVSIYDRSIGIELNRIWGRSYTVFKKTEVHLENYWDTDLKEFAEIHEVSQNTDEINSWSIKVKIKNPNQNLANYEGVNFHSIKNDAWRDSIYQRKNVLYLSVNSFGTERTSEIAFMNLGYRKNTDEETGTFVENIPASNLTISELDSEHVELSFKVNVPTIRNNVLVFRLHRVTAGIDHVYRQSQDHRVQDENGNTQGSKVRKYRSIWASEHPSVLNRGRSVPENFSKIPRHLTGTPEAWVITAAALQENNENTSNPIEYQPLSVIRATSENNLIRARFIRITKRWSSVEKSQGFKCYLTLVGDSGSYLLGEFRSSFDIDHWIFLHPEISNSNSSGQIDWRIKLSSLGPTSTEELTVPIADFDEKDLFSEFPTAMGQVQNLNMLG